ncbi:MAG: glycosyltransferase family 2 protein [Holophaga sp.]|nr:glycosyltransferase family 2 protein [Holophaga sp.]
MPGICAVIVTYHTGLKVTSDLETIACQVDHVIVVDNGSDRGTRSSLAAAQMRLSERITLLLNEENIGLSKAQNLGIGFALERGYDWIILLDDDSTPGVGMVVRMMNYYLGLCEEDRERVGILYPSIVDKNTSSKSRFLIESNGRIKLTYCPDDDVIYPIIAMSSGSLIKTDTLRAIGQMDETFFIDQIDVDFSLRIINSGLKIIAVGGAILYHSLGARREFRFLGMVITPTYHSAFRCYHMYRNRLIVWKRYIKSNFNFILFDILSSFYHLFKIVIFEDKKIAKIKAMATGVLDGLFHRVSPTLDHHQSW